MTRDVFVVDFETISPLGVGNDALLHSLKNDIKAGAQISRFNTDGFKHYGAAEIKDDLGKFLFDESELVKEIAYYDKKFAFIVAATKLLKTKVAHLLKYIDPHTSGSIIGLGIDVTPLELIDDYMQKHGVCAEKAYQNTIFEIVNQRKNEKFNSIANSLDLSAIYVAEKFNLGLFSETTLTACAASTQALAFGYQAIAQGRAEVVLAGGTDSIINLIAYTGFGKLGVVSSLDEDPADYCKPCDINRNGALVGEAGGLVLLASEDFVKKSGANPKLRVMGYGNSLDGYKITAPDPSGAGMKKAIAMAIESAGIQASDIDYINLHGTGTRSNDQVELDAILEVAGSSAKKIMVSSTKDRHGHAIAAAGVQEFNILCLAMENDFVPGIVNLKDPIYNSDKIDIVNENRQQKINYGMTNNFAFGGVNTSLILQKV